MKKRASLATTRRTAPVPPVRRATSSAKPAPKRAAGLREKAAAAPRSREGRLASEIGALIDEARRGVARAANAALTTLYWKIGSRIRGEVLQKRRAAYGEEIVAALGRRLEGRFGRYSVPVSELDSRVVEYLTELPPRDVLRERFHQALLAARARLASREDREEEADP